LLDLGHPEGIARLLEMAVDVDLPDASRIAAIKTARNSSPAAAAAVSFLVKRHDFPDWEFPYSAIDAIPDVVDDTILEGLALIIQNRNLTDGARLHAAALAAMSEGEPAYRQLLKQWSSADLTALLGEEAAHGIAEAWSVLWRMVTDPDLAPDRRFNAADELATLDDDSGVSALRILADDPDLDARYRRRAAAALADPSTLQSRP